MYYLNYIVHVIIIHSFISDFLSPLPTFVWEIATFDLIYWIMRKLGSCLKLLHTQKQGKKGIDFLKHLLMGIFRAVTYLSYAPYFGENFTWS